MRWYICRTIGNDLKELSVSSPTNSDRFPFKDGEAYREDVNDCWTVAVTAHTQKEAIEKAKDAFLKAWRETYA